MFVQVGSFDAKTKLPELLREVQAGRRFTITLRGKAVADLVPTGGAPEGDADAAVAAMQGFARIRGVDGDALQAWIAEGRR